MASPLDNFMHFFADVFQYFNLSRAMLSARVLMKP